MQIRGDKEPLLRGRYLQVVATGMVLGGRSNQNQESLMTSPAGRPGGAEINGTATLQAEQTHLPSAGFDLPSARFFFRPEEPEVGETVSFNAEESTDVDGESIGYRWEFTGDGGETNGRTSARVTDRGEHLELPYEEVSSPDAAGTDRDVDPRFRYGCVRCYRESDGPRRGDDLR